MSLNILAQVCDKHVLIEAAKQEYPKKKASSVPRPKLVSIIPQLPGGSSKTLQGNLNRYAEAEDDSVQKHLRMLRNRESAALSRKRKADKIDSLVRRVGELEAENLSLISRIAVLQETYGVIDDPPVTQTNSASTSHRTPSITRSVSEPGPSNCTSSEEFSDEVASSDAFE